MIAIRILVTLGLITNMLIGAIAGYLSAAFLELKWIPGQNIFTAIADTNISDPMAINTIGGAILGITCGVILCVYLFRHDLFCKESKLSRQLPAVAVVWMAGLMAIVAAVAFLANWILSTEQVDIFMTSNKFFMLLQYWMMIYIACGAAAGVIDGLVVLTAHIYCVKTDRFKQAGETD